MYVMATVVLRCFNIKLIRLSFIHTVVLFMWIIIIML